MATFERTLEPVAGRSTLTLVQGATALATWIVRYAHLALVAGAAALGLVILWPQTTPVAYVNDSSVHLAMVRWATQQISDGHIPLDGWYPYLSLGSAEFHHYQVLAHIVTAYVGMVVGATTAFNWSLYLLLALWPISVYAGTRMLGWEPWVAAVAALMSPVLVSASNFGFEHQAYTWQGYGVWTQLWGMFFFPLAVGLGWRAVEGRGSLALAALLLGITLASHFVVGYLAGLVVGIFVVVRPLEIPRRLLRAVAVGIGGLAVASWEIVPLLSDQKWLGAGEFSAGTFWNDSYGAPKVLDWLFHGNLFDSGRLPLVSVLVALGLAVSIWQARRDPRARAVILVFVASLLLFFGRPTFGTWLNLVPFSSALPLHRFIMGIHFAGLILAAVAVTWTAHWMIVLLRRFVPRVRPALVAVPLVVALVFAVKPAWDQVSAYDARDNDFKAAQQLNEATDGAALNTLFDRIKQTGGGRTYAGTPANWGRNYTVGYVPVYTMLTGGDIDGIGFTFRVASLMGDVEARFDESNLAQYEIFNVRYAILPNNQKPVSGATELARAGRHVLWQIPTTGYFEVVDTTSPPIVVDNGGDVGRATAVFIESPQLQQRQLPVIAYAGLPAAPATAAAGTSLSGAAGNVVQESDAPSVGEFGAEVVANRTAAVLLKNSYDPRVQATVDGADARSYMVAPALTAVTVPAGRHSVGFRYVPYPYYPELFALAAIALAALALGPRLARRWLRSGDHGAQG